MDLDPNHCGILDHSHAAICAVSSTNGATHTKRLISAIEKVIGSGTNVPFRITGWLRAHQEGILLTLSSPICHTPASSTGVYRYGCYPRYRPYRKATNCFAPRILFLTFSSVTPPCRNCCSNLISASFNSLLNSRSITRSNTLGMIFLLTQLTNSDSPTAWYERCHIQASDRKFYRTRQRQASS